MAWWFVVAAEHLTDHSTRAYASAYASAYAERLHKQCQDSAKRRKFHLLKMISEVESAPLFCSVTLHGHALSTGSQGSVLRRSSLSKFWLSAFMRKNCAGSHREIYVSLLVMIFVHIKVLPAFVSHLSLYSTLLFAGRKLRLRLTLEVV